MCAVLAWNGENIPVTASSNEATYARQQYIVPGTWYVLVRTQVYKNSTQ